MGPEDNMGLVQQNVISYRGHPLDPHTLGSLVKCHAQAADVMNGSDRRCAALQAEKRWPTVRHLFLCRLIEFTSRHPLPHLARSPATMSGGLSQQGFDHSLVHFILRRNEPSYGRTLFPIQPSARPPRRMPISRSRSSELKGRNGKLSWKVGAVENAGLLAVS